MIKDISVSSKIMNTITYVLLTIVLLITIFPVLHVISVSISSSAAYAKGITFYPRDLDFSAFKVIMLAGTVPHAFLNSVLYTSTGTFINLLLTSMMGFALSRRKLAFRKLYTVVVLVPMYFNGGLIPTYLLVKNLGLYNTIWAIVLPGAISVFNLIIMRTYFSSVPEELDESAHMDGANDMRIFFLIILPLSKASLATIGLFYAVAHWNSWFNSMIYLSDADRYPLQLIIRQIVMESAMERELGAAREGLINNVTSEAIQYATITISILPMIIVYPFVQKYFVKGVMIGSLKG